MLRFADKQVLPGLRRALPVVLSLALVLSGLGGLVALAEEAAVEVAEVGTFSGTLPGNRDSGSFAVYEVSYAGAELLTATVTPLYRDASQGPAFGMKLYLPDGSAVKDITRADGAYKEVLYTGDAATLFLQVFNYSADAVSFDLKVDGATAVTPVVAEEPAAEQPAAEEAAAEEPAAEQPAAEEAVAEEEVAAEEPAAPVAEEAAELPEGVLATGVLVGESNGAYVEATVVSTSADEALTITLETVPLDPSFGKASGFVVYGAEGSLVARGISDGKGGFSATFSGDVDESFLVQVYNYAAGQPLAYTLKVAQ
ncbi:MAG: hypothetical protein ACOX3S_00105 [Anaerolineae bacterium]|jgi:hypothetical protein